jgi:hypothetical protein
MNGGPLPLARPKRGRWIYEPKFNGWRAVVHTPTGSMFNRKGDRISIEHEFSPALAALKNCHDIPEWLDCEALERRHKLGQGSLIVFDYIPQSYDKTPLEARQLRLAQLLGNNGVEDYPYESANPPENKVLLLAYEYSETDPTVPDMTPTAAWPRLQRINSELGCQFFEGLVAKRLDSLYPTQLRSPDMEFPLWIKHRWEF